VSIIHPTVQSLGEKILIMPGDEERKEGQTKREWEIMVLKTEAELLRRKNQQERLNLEKEQLTDEKIMLNRASGNVDQGFIQSRINIITRKLTDGQNTMNRLSRDIIIFQMRLEGQKRVRDSF
jgi:hypothetical protein